MQATTAKLFEMVMTPQPGGTLGLAILTVHGFLDTHAIPDFECNMQRYVDDGFTRFILDTHDLTYISSAGIGSLVRLSNLLARLGGSMVLLPPPDKTFAIFDLLDFTKVLRFVATIEQALDVLQGRGRLEVGHAYC